MSIAFATQSTDGAGLQIEDRLSTVESLMRDLTGRHQNVVAEAAHAHLTSGGRRVRARLALQAAASLNLSEQTATAIAAACELVHNASLVHDDIQDRDTVRRERPAIWASFGTDVAICAGDLMLSAAPAALATASAEDIGALVAYFHHRVSDVIDGQCDDLAAAGGGGVELVDYVSIASRKSGPLLGLPIELTLLAAREDSLQSASEACGAFAVAYQIIDDLKDSDADRHAGSLNVLGCLGGCLQPETVARHIANSYCRHAKRLAESLPSNAGGMLASMARQMGAAALTESQP